MKASVVAVGNSRGIRIPKPVLAQCRIEDEVELEVKRGRIIIMPSRRKPREGWAEAFKAAHEKGDDALEIPEEIDAETGDWTW